MVSDLKPPQALFWAGAAGSTPCSTGSPTSHFGKEGREWFKACAGRNRLHSLTFTFPCITKKGKEIRSGDINLFLNTTNYLRTLDPQPNIWHLKAPMTSHSQGTLKPLLPWSTTGTEHRSLSRSSLTWWGLFCSAALAAALGHPALCQKRPCSPLQPTLSHPGGTNETQRRKEDSSLQQSLTATEKIPRISAMLLFRLLAFKPSPPSVCPALSSERKHEFNVKQSMQKFHSL